LAESNAATLMSHKNVKWKLGVGFVICKVIHVLLVLVIIGAGISLELILVGQTFQMNLFISCL